MSENISTTSGKLRDFLLNFNLGESKSDNHYVDVNANIGKPSISFYSNVEKLKRLSDTNIDEYSYKAIGKNVNDYESFKITDEVKNNEFSNLNTYYDFISKFNKGNNVSNSVYNAIFDGDTIGFSLGNSNNGSPVDTSSYSIVDLTDVKDLLSTTILEGDTPLGISNRNSLKFTFLNKSTASAVKKIAIGKELAEDFIENSIENIFNSFNEDEIEGKPLGLSNKITISDSLITNITDEITNGAGLDWRKNKTKLDVSSTIFHDEMVGDNINSNKRYISNYSSYIKKEKDLTGSSLSENSKHLLEKNTSRGLRKIILNNLKRNLYNVYSDDSKEQNGYLSNLYDLTEDNSIEKFPKSELWNSGENYFGQNQNRNSILNKMKELFSSDSKIKTFINEKNENTNPNLYVYDSVNSYGVNFNNNENEYDLNIDKQLSDIGLRTLSKKSYSVLNGSKKPKIARYNTDVDSSSSLNSFDKMSTTQRYMFSIENLAWKGFLSDDDSVKYGPNKGRIMWFPPYNLNFTDNVSASWNSDQFIGRGEPIYTYVNTERSGTLNFTLIVDYPSFLDFIPEGIKNDGLTNYFKKRNGIEFNTKLKKDNNFKEENSIIDIDGIETEIANKLKCFSPAFHSSSPEGFNDRLTFLHQCTRQGPTYGVGGGNYKTATNLAFGRAPVCVLRLGDFYNQKIIIDNINITYEPLLWDLNKEGIGVQPQLANISMSFKFVGGGDLSGPIRELQNAISFNFFANTSLYNKSSKTNENVSLNDTNKVKSEMYNMDNEVSSTIEDIRVYNDDVIKNINTM